MITEKQRAKRLRDHEELKRFAEMHLSVAKTESEKEHLKAYIAEIEGDIEATKLPEPKALLPKTTETAEIAAKKPQYHKKKGRRPRVGNPF